MSAASVIISIYNRLDNLELILTALEKQTVKSFEVIVSEDNDSPITAEFINKARERFSFTIKHISQEDIGFRKTMALNKAVVASEYDYLIFLDGDCVPHEKLVETYLKYLTPDTICLGRRCYLDKSLTDRLYKTKDMKVLSVLNLLLHTKRRKRAFYIPPSIKKPNVCKKIRRIIGCNWAIHKQNILDINGYDEDYTHAAVGEDIDIDWRLRLLNDRIIFLNVKYQAITYHLYHPKNYSGDDVNKSRAMKDEKMKTGNYVCKNGIRKL